MTEQQARAELLRVLKIHTTTEVNAAWQPIANGINEACKILSDVAVIFVSAIYETGKVLIDLLQPLADAYAKANGRMVDATPETGKADDPPISPILSQHE
jgi:hypothetical protein